MAKETIFIIEEEFKTNDIEERKKRLEELFINIINKSEKFKVA